MKSPKMLFFRMIVGFLMFPLVSQYLGLVLLISDEGANLIIEFQSKEFNTNQIISADGSLILAGLCFKGMGIKFNE